MKYSKNIIIKCTAFIIAIATLIACSGISIRSDWDPEVDFSKFKTFYVLEEERQSINPFVDQRINSAIVADLTSKGFQPVDTPNKADLAIGYQVTTENRTSFQTLYSGWEQSGFHRSRASRRHGWQGTSWTTQNNYTVGTLVVAIFEMTDKELVWEASGSDTVSPSRDPARNEQRINDAVQRILSSFPPGA